MAAGDLLLFTDWRGDPDQRLDRHGPEVAGLLSAAARPRCAWSKGWCGVRTSTGFAYSARRTAISATRSSRPAASACSTCGSAPADRTTRSSSCSPSRPPERDVAFVGGIDLCHSRRDDAGTRGDPQPISRWPPSTAHRPPWHDVQLRPARPGRRRPRADLPGTLERPGAAAPGTRSPRSATGSAGRPTTPARCRRQPPDPPPAARRPCSCCGPIRRSAGRTRSHPTANAASPAAMSKPSAAPAPHLPRGPVPVVDRGRRLLRRRAARQPGPAPDRRGAPPPRLRTAGCRCRPT